MSDDMRQLCRKLGKDRNEAHKKLERKRRNDLAVQLRALTFALYRKKKQKMVQQHILATAARRVEKLKKDNARLTKEQENLVSHKENLILQLQTLGFTDEIPEVPDFVPTTCDIVMSVDASHTLLQCDDTAPASVKPSSSPKPLSPKPSSHKPHSHKPLSHKPSSPEPSSPPKSSSLLGKMFQDVEKSLLKQNQDSEKPQPDPEPIQTKVAPPVLSCTSSGNMILMQCKQCNERVAFSSKVSGLVVCPHCSSIIVQFKSDKDKTKSTTKPTNSLTQNKVREKKVSPHAKLKMSKAAKPAAEDVIDLDSEGNDDDNNLQGETPSKVTSSDVMDILKDGVKGYVDNVDGDEVIVVLK